MSIHPQNQTSSAPIVFRLEVQNEDRNRVRAIVASTGVFSPAEIEVAVELLDERLEKGPSSGYHFVFAQRAGSTLGYACYGPIALTAASYDLYWIAVDKTCQGQKIGQLLLTKSEELIRAAGGRQIYIETSNRAQYSPTREFYLRRGYRQDALLKDFYAPGDDKVIYVKAILPCDTTGQFAAGVRQAGP
ncbi:MAG: GNAT family N-acetyltransferase [Thermoguttaceae bacterium]|jgi:ribosomal protein S18 acetylase RimI-like enzyme